MARVGLRGLVYIRRGLAVAYRHNHEFSSIHHVSAGRRKHAAAEKSLPKSLPRLGIIGAKLIVQGSSAEQKAAFGSDIPAPAIRSRPRDAARRQFVVFSMCDLPYV